MGNTSSPFEEVRQAIREKALAKVFVNSRQLQLEWKKLVEIATPKLGVLSGDELRECLLVECAYVANIRKLRCTAENFQEHAELLFVHPVDFV